MRAIVLAGAFVIALATAAFAADGVIEINQARAMAGGVTPGDTPGFPVTISLPGSYRLTGNLTTTSTNDAGILLGADNVTIDLNGFAISVGSSGIYGPQHKNIRVANGSIMAGYQGIVLEDLAHVERVRVIGVATTSRSGIQAGQDAIVSGCLVSDFTVVGISALSGVITGNVVTSNRVGIGINDGLVTSNSIYNNTGMGLSGFFSPVSHAGYSGNNFLGNNGGLTTPQVSGGLQIGPNMCNRALCP